MNYAIDFTAAGLDYVRRVLGTRPHDEVRPLLAEIERQIAQQEALGALESREATLLPTETNGAPVRLNGAGGGHEKGPGVGPRREG